jgi:hypothetical protein
MAFSSCAFTFPKVGGADKLRTWSRNCRISTRSGQLKIFFGDQVPQFCTMLNAAKESLRICGGERERARINATSSQWVLLRGAKV